MGTKLSILIPTRNRADFLSVTISTFANQIRHSGIEHSVEIVCVNNHSTDRTEISVTRLIEENPDIQISLYLQPVPRDTAETSLFGATIFAKSDYVWCFGDDDLPLPESIERILGLIDQPNPPAYILLNTNISLPRNAGSITYFEPTPAVSEFSSGLELFQQYGLVTATTTISCLVFNRRLFQTENAFKLSEISQVYSHSAACLLSFANSPAAVINTPCLLYRQNSAEEEGGRFLRFCEERNLIPQSLFTSGLCRLIEAVAQKANLDVSEIYSFREIEVSKGDWKKYETTLGLFISRFAYDRLIDLTIQRSSKTRAQDFEIYEHVTEMLRKSNKIFRLAAYIAAAKTVFSLCSGCGRAPRKAANIIVRICRKFSEW